MALPPPPPSGFPELSSKQADAFITFLVLLGIAASIGGATALWTSALDELGEVLKMTMALIGVVAFVCLIALLYATLIEPRRVSITRRSIAVRELKTAVTMAIVADFHVGPFVGASFVRKIVRRTLEQNTDMIVLPGDFVLDEDASMDALKELSKLAAPLGVYAVTGNHDSGHMHGPTGAPKNQRNRTEELASLLQEHTSVMLLRNESKVLKKDNSSFALAGVDDMWTDEADLAQALTGTDDLPTILLSHHPDTMLDPLSRKADVVIAGHTHGGQVRLPGIGAAAGVPSALGKTYDQGVFLFDRTNLVITRGCGESLLRIRFLCPPEIFVLTLTPDATS